MIILSKLIMKFLTQLSTIRESSV